MSRHKVDAAPEQLLMMGSVDSGGVKTIPVACFIPPSSLRLDGESVWQPARDVGLPEGLPADPGGEDRLLARLQHPGDPLTVQGEMRTQKRAALLITCPKVGRGLSESERGERYSPINQRPQGKVLPVRPCGL